MVLEFFRLNFLYNIFFLHSFFFFFFFFSIKPQKSKTILPSLAFFPLLLLPQTSKPISQNPKPKNHDLEFGAKIQTQKSRSRHLERLGFVDLGTKGLFSVFSNLVCLLICFLCFLGWSVSGGIFFVLNLCFFIF